METADRGLITMMTLDQITAYLNANPQIRDSTAQWLQQQGDNRSVYQWVTDDINNDPTSVHKAQYASWAQANPSQVSDGGQQVPLEQGLLDQALPQLQNEIAGDADRSALAQALQALNVGDTQTYSDLMNQIQSGQLLAGQNATATQTGNTLASDAAAAAAAEGTANTTQNASLLAAQAPLGAARIGAAEDQVTGVNLGLQSALDQLTAQRAGQGYVGGSSMDDAAVARAGIGAGQDAASILGQAKTANAGDIASINALQANQQYGIGNTLAQSQQSDYDAAAKQQQQNYMNQFPSQLAAALTTPGFTQSVIGSNATGDQYANSGLNNALGTLNWWTTNQGTPPTPGAVATTAPNTGNQIAALGTGLLSSALSIGNNQNWWQTNTPPVDPYTTPVGNYVDSTPGAYSPTLPN